MNSLSAYFQARKSVLQWEGHLFSQLNKKKKKKMKWYLYKPAGKKRVP